MADPSLAAVAAAAEVGAPASLPPPAAEEFDAAAAAKRWVGWPGDSVFRLVVPVLKVGSIIGRKGELIKRLVEETKARVRILEGPVGATERIVLVSGKEDPGMDLPPAIDALMRVFKRVIGITDGAAEGTQTAPGVCAARLLVPGAQAINLIGKQGATIKAIQESTGATIRVISVDEQERPFYVTDDERIVEIQGETEKVVKALQAVSNHLRKFLVDHSVLPLFEKTNSTASQDRSDVWSDMSHSSIGSAQVNQPPSVVDEYILPVKREPLFLEREPLVDHSIHRSGVSLYGRDPALSSGFPCSSIPCRRWSAGSTHRSAASSSSRLQPRSLAPRVRRVRGAKTMAGHRNSHGKRHSDYAENGGGKRRNPGDDTYAPGPDDTVYRYLCTSRKIGSIIGKGGEIAKQLRSETQAKIRIGESVPGCDERVITIFSSSRETNTIGDAEDKVCPAQDALFRVHERLATDEGPGNEENEEMLPQVTVRLLVPSDQIGCIIGKGGHIIQGIRSDTGAQIRVLSNDHIPACAISGDELLQISGDAAVVRKALRQVSSRLHDNPSRSQHLLASSLTQPYPGSSHLGSSSTAPVIGIAPVVPPYGGYKGDVAGDWPSIYQPRRDESSAKEFSLRLLCAAANVGGVIGKGGGIIKQIRQESGAFIKVDSSNSGAEDDCIITVSAKEFFEDPVSPTIDAAVRLQPRCSDKSDAESGEPSYTTRLLVSTSRIGCLIGKGGSIISEIRRSSRANIRILSKENVPKVAAEDEEMVQISGDLDVARHALVQIATRLKANFFEREGALSAFPPVIPYHPLPAGVSDEPKYLSRDPKPAGHGYLYSSGYRASDDMIPADSYANYSRSQAAGGGYGAYSGYSGRSGTSGLSGNSSLPYAKRHGY